MAGFLYQIFRFSGGVNIRGMIRQSKSWHYLGPSRRSKVDFFAEIVFGYKPLTIFVKGSNLNVWLVPASWKKHVISTPICLSLLFQEKTWLIKRGLGGQSCNKKGVGRIYKNLHFIFWEVVLINEIRQMVCSFS